MLFASAVMVEPSTTPGCLGMFIRLNRVSLMTCTMRGWMARTATLQQLGLALVLPVVLTVILSLVTLRLYQWT